MNIFEKKILLDTFRSHYHSYIPYVGIEYDGMGRPIFPEDGNWGEYPYDIDLCKCEEFSDLKIYFGYDSAAVSARVSYLQIVEKYRLLVNIINTAYYKRKIMKGGKEYILEHTPTLSEKYSIAVISLNNGESEDDSGENISNTINEYRIWGEYPDDSFNENGGLRMLNFTSRVLGFFVIDSEYIGDNYVPDIMCYSEVDAYRQNMRSIKDCEDETTQKEYMRYGGDQFYVYLGGKLLELSSEIDYWSKRLYIINNEPVTSDVALTISLNSEFRNIGNYNVINDEEDDNISHEKRKCTNIEDSKLKFLRHTKVSYCEKKVNGTSEEEALPFILIEDETTNRIIAKTPYMVGYAKNVQMNFDKFYGDLITSIIPVDNEKADMITYIMGAEINYDYSQQMWYVIDETVGVKYSEKVGYEIYDYTQRDDLSYPLIKDGIEVNAFKDSTLIEGINSIKVYEMLENAEVTSEFWVYDDEEMGNNRIIMEDYNFGKIDTSIENIGEINIDRGYVSAFELLYKMGEINTMDDIVSYSNNIFGI